MNRRRTINKPLRLTLLTGNSPLIRERITLYPPSHNRILLCIQRLWRTSPRRGKKHLRNKNLFLHNIDLKLAPRSLRKPMVQQSGTLMLEKWWIARRKERTGSTKETVKRNSKLSGTGRSRHLHKTSKLTAKRIEAERAEKLLTIRREVTESPTMNLLYSPLMWEDWIS